MKWKILLIALSLLGIFLSSCSKDPRGVFLKKTFKSDNGGELSYRLLLPPDSTNRNVWPLVIFLHGSGERGDDNEKQLTHGVTIFQKKENLEKFPAFVIAPQCPKEKRWVNIPWDEPEITIPEKPSEPARMVLELIDQVMKKYPVDEHRVYITGLSMGGFGTWDLMARRPGLFAAAVPVCGGGDPATADKIKDIPVWTFHGADDQVVPPELTRRMVRALREAGGLPFYTELKKTGHNAWDPTYNNPRLLPWLFAQSRMNKTPITPMDLNLRNPDKKNKDPREI